MLIALLEVVFGIIYVFIAAVAWLVFTGWLHDTKVEFGQSWILSAIVGLSLAFVWPLSLIMLSFYENFYEKH